MGVTGHDEFPSMGPHIPMYPVNHSLANMCYLIRHNPADNNKSHMSVLVDIGGNSTEKSLIGLLIHLTADMDDGLCPHSTELRCDLSQLDRDTVQIIPLGFISQSKYVLDPTAFPSYFLDADLPVHIHMKFLNHQTNINYKRGVLTTMASAVYEQMRILNGEERWTSLMNCQQFAYRFTVEAIGLCWPNDVNIVGDVLPTTIDVAIMCISSTNKMTRKSR